MMLEDISAAARLRHWVSGRRDKDGVGREVSDSDVGSNGPPYDVTEIVNAGWSNYPVWVNDGRQGIELRGMSG